MAGIGLDAAAVRHHDLTGADVPLEPGAHGVQRAGLGGEYHRPVLEPAHAQRAEPVGIPGGDELGGGGDHQGIGALDPVHGGGHGLLDGGGPQALLDDDVGDDLRVRGGLEDGAPALQLGAQLVGVGEVSVVGQGHAALVVVDQDGLDIALVVAAGGTVADVAHGDVAGAQRPEPLLGEDLAHEAHVPVGGEDTVVVDGDARALLAPVLQGIKRVIRQGGHVGRGLRIHAEDAALLVDVALLSDPAPGRARRRRGAVQGAAAARVSLHHGPAVSS